MFKSIRYNVLLQVTTTLFDVTHSFYNYWTIIIIILDYYNNVPTDVYMCGTPDFFQRYNKFLSYVYWNNS